MSIDDLPTHHTFVKPIRSVAVIGSGATGTPAAKHLLDAGLTVKVFERQSQPGGIWNYSPEIGLPISVPTPPPSIGAFTPVLKEYGPNEKERDVFSPSNPCYWNLTNNVPSETMTYKNFPWPEGTGSTIPHYQLAAYIHSYARHFGIDQLTSYDTRVETIEKVGDEWKVNVRRVIGTVEEFWTESFDAVVVATGHYNAPYIPNIQGADVWARQWKDKVIHSQGYRTVERYVGKNVLIVGAGTSGVDIAHDLASHSQKTYIVGRDVLRGPEAYRNQRNWQRNLVPPNGELLSEIKAFHPPEESSDGESRIEDGVIELSDGRKITGISGVIFATGYQYSFPFLQQYHRDPIPSPGTIVQGHVSASLSQPYPLVTDGSGVLNLYRDVFYIPDPTLTFIGLSVNTAAFNFFEYQSLSIARVFSNLARLPNEDSRWKWYEGMIKEKGEGKFSHLMNKDGERKYVRETVDWLNNDSNWSGAEYVQGHTEEWLRVADQTLARIAAKYGIDKDTAERLRQNNPQQQQLLVDKEKNALNLGEAGEGIAVAALETNRKAAEALARKSGIRKI